MKKEASALHALIAGNAAHRPVHEIREQADGVERFLALEVRARVLDLACGSGQQTVELARRGYRVLGIDPSSAPSRPAHAERLNVHFLKCDVRAIAYRAEFDAVVSLSASFGRLPGERDDLKTLEAVKRSLKPGGKLLLDLPNREELMRGGVPFNLETGRLEGPRESLRVYALTEVKGLIAQAGLAYRGAFGGFDGSAYGPDSRRLIVLAEKSRESERPLRKTEETLVSAIRIKGRR